jgi:hypothetical protein
MPDQVKETDQGAREGYEQRAVRAPDEEREPDLPPAA